MKSALQLSVGHFFENKHILFRYTDNPAELCLSNIKHKNYER